MSSVLSLYKQVIENVVEKMQNEFINAGIDESVLTDLRSIWLQKLYASSAFSNTDYVPEYGAGNPTELEDDDVLYASTSFPFMTTTGTAAGGGAGNGRNVPQLDGQYSDDEDEEQEEEDTQQPQVAQVQNDDELNSDLDDDDEEQVDTVETNNRLLCQFEKVTRSRNRWKCVLKDGIASINGKDYAFHKAQCDFEF